MTMHLLVVCVGNICRSPMAEALLRDHHPGLAVMSAGLAALSGQPMHPDARAVLREHGIDAGNHLARQLHHGLIEQADLILCMERAHVDAINHDLPDARYRTCLLDAWHRQQDIPDPYGQPRAAFEQVYDMIHTAVQSWLPRLAG